MRRKILILCTANSARSQMAEGLARQLGGHEIEVASAGAEPSRVHPLAIRAMDELGIDISMQRSKSLDEYLDTAFDDVLTVCDRASQHCPVFPGPARRTHWSLEDPAAAEGGEEERLESFRQVRDELARRLADWLRS